MRVAVRCCPDETRGNVYVFGDVFADDDDDGVRRSAFHGPRVETDVLQAEEGEVGGGVAGALERARAIDAATVCSDLVVASRGMNLRRASVKAVGNNGAALPCLRE